jgi:sulfoxide reductase heme-binding subunit YedZ
MSDRLRLWGLWLLFSLPALGMAWDFATSANPRIAHILVHPSGEFAARFLIVTLMATPLRMLLPDWRFPRWLVRHRRHFGVAAFGYAALHTVFYLIDRGSLAATVEQLPRFYIWTGWVAFAIMLPLAATSFDAAVRAMGTRWKALQRWTYAAAVLTLLHWASLHHWGSWVPAAVHFAPLAALELWRFGLRRPRAPARPA